MHICSACVVSWKFRSVVDAQCHTRIRERYKFTLSTCATVNLEVKRAVSTSTAGRGTGTPVPEPMGGILERFQTVASHP